MSEPKVYASEDAAQRRVERLNQAGIWPGMRRVEGGWVLTVDPDDTHRAPSAGG